MEMMRVISSAISAIGYNPQTRRMKIRFKQGATYKFCRVPEHVFQKFLNATSKGTYYNNYVRDKYQCN